jgi:hypothetical protein
MNGATHPLPPYAFIAHTWKTLHSLCGLFPHTWRPKGRIPLGRPGVDGRIILKLIFKKWNGGMDWIELAQDRKRWRALLNAIMNLLFP